MLFKDLMIEVRKQKLGLSQSEMAHILKISQMTISFFESGQRKPNFKTLRRIVEFINNHPELNMNITYKDIDDI